MDPLALLVAGLLGAACGLLGGMGGTRQLRRDVRDLEDDVEQVQRRLSRHEGKRGADRKAIVEEELAKDVTALVRGSPGGSAALLVGGGGAAPAPPRSRAELLATIRRRGSPEE